VCETPFFRRGPFSHWADCTWTVYSRQRLLKPDSALLMNIKAIFEPMSSMWSLLFSSSNHFCKVSTKEMLDYGREIVAGLRRSRHRPRRPCMRLAFSGRENHTGSIQSILNSNALAGPCEKPFLKVGFVAGENCFLESRSNHRPELCRRSPNVRHQTPHRGQDMEMLL
jgi:hypothetical protein